MRLGLKITDLLIVAIIVGVMIIGQLYAREHLDKQPVYYCVEGHKFVQSMKIETILPVFGDDDKPVKCKEER